MALNEDAKRDLAGGKSGATAAAVALTAADTTTLTGDTYALADEGAVIINNRSRIAEIEAALQAHGILL